MSKIAIFSLSRSGSTLLHYTFAQSLPSHTAAFEPQSVTTLTRQHPNLIVKCIVDRFDEANLMEQAAQFDKRIILLRDPRDRLISSYLFGLHGESEGLLEKVSNIQRKEQNPSGVPFVQLVCDTTPNMTEANLRSYIQSTLRKITPLLIDHVAINGRNDEFQQNTTAYKYEDLIRSDFDGLEKFLNVTLINKATIPDHHAYGKRAVSVGQWKNWFCASDVAFFQPILEPFMSAWGYTNDWSLNSVQNIEPEHASGFVLAARENKEHYESKDLWW